MMKDAKVENGEGRSQTWASVAAVVLPGGHSLLPHRHLQFLRFPPSALLPDAHLVGTTILNTPFRADSRIYKRSTFSTCKHGRWTDYLMHACVHRQTQRENTFNHKTTPMRFQQQPFFNSTHTKPAPMSNILPISCPTV